MKKINEDKNTSEYTFPSNLSEFKKVIDNYLFKLGIGFESKVRKKSVYYYVDDVFLFNISYSRKSGTGNLDGIVYPNQYLKYHTIIKNLNDFTIFLTDVFNIDTLTAIKKINL